MSVYKKHLLLTTLLLGTALSGTGCTMADRVFEDVVRTVVEDVVDKKEAVTESNSTSETTDFSEESQKETTAMPVESASAGDESDMIYYQEILDDLYHHIDAGAVENLEYSYLFRWGYSGVETVSDAGYKLIDLDQNGIDELIVTSKQEAEEGFIYDLFTYYNGGVVSLASSGERYRYYLSNDNNIYFEGSSGAGNSCWEMYMLPEGQDKLYLETAVEYNAYENESNPWFRYDGSESEVRKSVSESEALRIQENFKKIGFEITTFDRYRPTSKMPDDLALRKAFRDVVGTEANQFFVCSDYDGNGTLEAFGITGRHNGWDVEDASLYFINHNREVTFIREFDRLYDYGGKEESLEDFNRLEVETSKFLLLGGYLGQEIWVYGVRGENFFESAASGKHADFYRRPDGVFCGEPHEGGAGAQVSYYNYDAQTGDFAEMIKDEESDVVLQNINALLTGLNTDTPLFVDKEAADWSEEAIRTAMYEKLLQDQYLANGYLAKIVTPVDLGSQGWQYDLELIKRIAKDAFGRDLIVDATSKTSYNAGFYADGPALFLMPSDGECGHLIAQQYEKDGERLIVTGTAVREYSIGTEYVGRFFAVVQPNPSSLYGYTLESLHRMDSSAYTGLTVEVSSILENDSARYGAGNLVDGDSATAWVEGAAGVGIHEWVKIRNKTEPVMNVTAIELELGYQKDWDVFSRNGSPRKIQVEFSDGCARQIDVFPEFDFASVIVLDAPVKTEWIKITILEAAAGSKYSDTCISEIRVH